LFTELLSNGLAHVRISRGFELSDPSFALVLLKDALERVALGDRKPILSIVVDALNDNFVLAIVLD
jgi:hypothetical protein